jgi:TetR/AcrR family transcriptional regulator
MSTDSPAPKTEALAGVRKRPKPGERRIQILQTLAQMLEQPAERITTAALAARLQVSEAALYRHFASKAQMFEGLIDFIEQSVFLLVNQVQERELDGRARLQRLAGVLVQFAEKNPGMTRVMVGDALVHEHERLQARMNFFFDKLEASFRQVLRESAPVADPQVLASVLMGFLLGRLQRYARSGFTRLPSEHLDDSLALLLG